MLDGPHSRDEIITARLGKFDAVTLLLVSEKLPKPAQNVRFLTKGEQNNLSVGMELGWLGYPRIAPGELCFFSGRVSSLGSEQFLVDGTAIHGVSGGPAFCITSNGLRIVGSVTAYRYNMVDDVGPLPGLSIVTPAFAHRDIAISSATGSSI